MLNYIINASSNQIGYLLKFSLKTFFMMVSLQYHVH